MTDRSNKTDEPSMSNDFAKAIAQNTDQRSDQQDVRHAHENELAHSQ